MRFVRLLRVLAVALILFCIPVVVYYAWEVGRARQFTEDTVLPAARAAHYPISVSDLTPHRLDILLKVEDPRFFQHRGVDLSTPGAGITTITQALVKQLYFEKFSPGIAKIRQTLIAAFALNPLMPKEEQLRLFLNTAYLGRDVKGFEQAAHTYFDKSFRELTDDEYTSIVAMLIAPEVFNVRTAPALNAERVVRIRKLVSGEYVPRGLFDLYYGPIDPAVRKDLPPLSYFDRYYH